MAEKVSISMLGMLDKKATQAMIQKQLKEIGKSSKVTFGTVSGGLKESTKQMKEYSKAQQMVNAQLIKQTIKERELANISGKSAKESAKVFQEKAKALSLVNSKLTSQAIKERELSQISGKSAKESFKAFESLNPELVKAEKGMGGLAKTTKKAGQSFGEIIVKFTEWIAVSTLVFGTIGVIKGITESIKELDSAMVEFEKVSNISKEALVEYTEEAKELGKVVNETGEQVLRASAEFRRMGFDDETSMQLAEDAIVLTKIADGIDDVTTSTTAMIAIMQGFNLEAEDSRHVIDAINKVSNEYAINTDSLADGLRRVGGVMAQSNTSLEETIGLLTAGQESLQSIEKVSSGLITISSRMRRVEESVEDADGKVVKLGEAFKEYAGIDLQKPNGELRSTYDVLTDLSYVWDTLDDETQSYLAFLLSGTRQTPVLTAIMSNLETTVGATADAMNSTNSAMEEMEKVTSSVSGQMDELNATWDRMKTGLFSSETARLVLEGANAVALLAEKMHTLEAVLTSPTFSIFNNQVMPRFIEYVKWAEGNVKDLTGATEEYQRVLEDSAKTETKAINDGIALQKKYLAMQLAEAQATQEASEKGVEYWEAYEQAMSDRYNLMVKSNSESEKFIDGEADYGKAIDKNISTLSSLANTYDGLNDKEQLSLDTVASLALQYPKYASQILKLNDAGADRKSILETLMEIERKQAIENIKNLRAQFIATNNLYSAQQALDKLSMGSAERLFDQFPEWKGFNDLLSELSSIEIGEGNFIQEILGGGDDTEKATKSLSAYFDQVNAIREAQEEIARLEAKEQADGIDLTKEKVEQYKQLQKIYAQYATLLRQEKAELEAIVLEGDEEVERLERIEELESLIVKNSTDWLLTQSDINGLLNVTEDLTTSIEASLDAMKDDREALNDLIDLTVDLIKQETENYKDQLNDRKEALKLAKDEADLQEDLANLNKDKADLEQDLLLLKLDNSKTNNKRILETEQAIAEKSNEIDEKLEEDKYNRQVRILDEEISLLEDYLSKEGLMRQDAIDRINESYKNGTDQLMNELLTWNSIYGDSMDTNIISTWETAKLAMESYGGSLGGISQAMNNINTQMLETQAALNSANWHVVDTQAEKDALHNANRILYKQINKNATFDPSSGLWNVPSASGSNSGFSPNVSLPSPSTGVSAPSSSVNNNSNSFNINVPIYLQGGNNSTAGALQSAGNSIGNSIVNTMKNRGMLNIKTI